MPYYSSPFFRFGEHQFQLDFTWILNSLIETEPWPQKNENPKKETWICERSLHLSNISSWFTISLLYDFSSGSSSVLFLTWLLVLSSYSVLCVSQVHLPQHPSRGDIDAALEWRLLFDIDAPLWYYMQIDRDEGSGCLMCKLWFWGTANVHTTAFLLIAFPVESRNFIRERLNVSLKKRVAAFMVWTSGRRSVFNITTLIKIIGNDFSECSAF